MPHFIIEHGNALDGEKDTKDAIQIAFQCGEACGFIDPADIKVRLRPYTDFFAGDRRTSFIHITVRLLSGRTAAQKESLTVAMRDTLDARFPKVQSISIEICDMDRGSYKKRLV
jgi:5-carboxymethyl-2-hydroxymuconate isomerase